MELKNLAAALVKAQAEMTGAKKDTDNLFFKSKYADLASVDAAIGPAAAKHGLGYIQIAHNFDHAAAIETIIIHESGETFACGVVVVPVSKADAQGFGSAMTYARRYSLAAAFGVCPEDDDGNAATKAAPKEKPKASISPNDVGKDYHEAATGDERTKIDAAVLDIQTMLSFGDAEKASKHFYAIGTQEQMAAAWSQLNSKERAEIKRFKNEAVPA